jgi:hypothetical protein
MSDVGKKLEKPFRTGRSAAEREAEKQKKLIAEQQRREELRLAEAESDVLAARARGRRGAAGRRSLIATSETGISRNLGGTNAAT